MCGIAFIYNNSCTNNQQQSVQRIQDCIKQLIHRGPDEGNIYSFDNAHLGHRRLSIIDITESHQPFIDPTGRYGLVYNGEIYNYKELREQLKNKWQFKTLGDTEVLLAGLILYGIDFVQKMEGMWAFALWDKLEKTLILCRDRIGKKPLYYQQTESTMYVASELPALKKLCPTNFQEDLNSTSDYFRYGYYLPGSTAYQDVKEVLPGHYLIWKPSTTVSEKCYWKLNANTSSVDNKTAHNQLREKLITSVEKRMVADVEVGAFLSGGVDSSLIVGIMSQELGITPKTFTIGFTESAYDESHYAKQIADLYHTQHYKEVFSTFNINDLIKLSSQHVGQPFNDSSLLPTAMVSKIASQHVKVALSGDGGDELFSGYQRYQARTILRWFSRLPKILQNNITKLVRSFPEPMTHHSRSLLKKAHLFLDIVARQQSETPYFAPRLYSDELYQQLAPELIKHGHSPPCIPEMTEPSDIQRMMLADSLIYLPQDILLKVDRASMSKSLETRAPFLDTAVIEHAFSMPVNWHRNNFEGKISLKKAFNDLLPREIWQRRKQGFGVPIHEWFRGQLGNDLKTLIHEVDSPLNKKFMLEKLSIHQDSKRDFGYHLWLFYTYLLWKRGIT